MTSNQIAYAEAIENQRHNETMEDETYRHNVALEEMEASQLKLSKWQTAANIVGNAINVVTSGASNVGSIVTKVAANRIQEMAVLNNRKIAEANLKLNELKINRDYSLGLVNATNSFVRNSNDYQIGMFNAINSMNILSESIRHNSVSERLQKQQADTNLLSVNNSYAIESSRIANEAAKVKLSRYQTDLDSLFTNDKINLERDRVALEQQRLSLEQQKLALDQERINLQGEANLINKKGTKGKNFNNFLSNVLSAGEIMLKLVP